MKINYEPAILWPCLFVGLCAIHPLFIFGVFYSAYKYREPWIKQIHQQLSTYKWWYFAFPVFAFVIGYLNVQPFVLDDLMHHVVAYKFSYDYHGLFVYAPSIPTFNPWIGFQIIAGKFHQLLGPEYSVRIIQAIAVVLFYTSFFLALHKILKHRSDKWLWCTIIFVLFAATPMGFRIFLARPDIFLTAWLISAVFLRPVVWLIIGILLAPTYSLSIIYAPCALLLNTSWRNRIIYAALFSLSCIVFWYIYSSGEWLNLPSLYSKWAANRIPGVGIGEILSTIYMINNIYFLSLLLILFYFLYKASFKLTAQAIPFYLLIIYFLLPDFLRYLTIVLALVGLLCAMYVPKEIRFNQTTSLIILIFSALIASKAIPNIPYENLPKFKMPIDAIVLTKYDIALSAGILHNPQAKFAPAMEIGANDKAVQTLILNLHHGGPIDCEELKRFSFTHVQENSLAVMPSCLSLAQVDGKWRLWEINK